MTEIVEQISSESKFRSFGSETVLLCATLLISGGEEEMWIHISNQSGIHSASYGCVRSEEDGKWFRHTVNAFGSAGEWKKISATQDLAGFENIFT